MKKVKVEGKEMKIDKSETMRVDQDKNVKKGKRKTRKANHRIGNKPLSGKQVMLECLDIIDHRIYIVHLFRQLLG